MFVYDVDTDADADGDADGDAVQCTASHHGL